MMERVIHLISQIGGIGSISADDGIYEAGFSSVRVLELLLALEEEFGVSIPDQEFMAARTAREIFGLVERLQEPKAA